MPRHFMLVRQRPELFGQSLEHVTDVLLRELERGRGLQLPEGEPLNTTLHFMPEHHDVRIEVAWETAVEAR